MHYYKWLKDFVEAGKGRRCGDVKREVTSDEVNQLGGEKYERLKQLVTELSLENLTLKRSQTFSTVQCHHRT
jgi:hypothetical protein